MFDLALKWVQFLTFAILVLTLLGSWIYVKRLNLRNIRLGVDSEAQKTNEWPPAPAEGRGEEKKLTLSGKATYYLRLRARHGLTIDNIDVRFVKKDWRWAWPLSFWRWESNQSELTMVRVSDCYNDRLAHFPRPDPGIRDNGVGGWIIRYRNPYNLLARDSIWLSIEVEVHERWKGKLEVMTPTKDRRRTYQRMGAQTKES